MKESPVQRVVLDYLAATGVLAFRQNTGVANMGGRYVAFGVPGMGDVLAFPTGKPVLWIECKATKGRQSDLQKSFQRQVEEHGHRYVLARSLEDVLPYL